MSDARNIWVGDWQSKLKTQNKQLANMTADEKKAWDAQRAIGEKLYKKYHAGPYIAFELSNANVFWANTYILKQRAEARSKALKASAQAFMPGDGPGGRLGEIIAAPKQSQKVVGLKVSPVANARAEGSPPGSRNRRQITIVIELG